MHHAFFRIAVFALLAAFVAVAAGCSAAEVIPYPNLGTIKRMKERLLSKEEKEEEIRELTFEQKHHQAEAERELEKR